LKTDLPCRGIFEDYRTRKALDWLCPYYIRQFPADEQSTRNGNKEGKTYLGNDHPVCLVEGRGKVGKQLGQAAAQSTVIGFDQVTPVSREKGCRLQALHYAHIAHCMKPDLASPTPQSRSKLSDRHI
jgi:hypothetical protein